MLKKIASLIFAATLAMPAITQAADPVQLEVSLADKFSETFSLAGHGAFVKFSHFSIPNTLLEVRLIAPDPLIVDFKEISTDGQYPDISRRVKLLAPGSTFSVAEIKGGQFHHDYVLARPR